MIDEGVWRNGGMTLTGENTSTGREILSHCHVVHQKSHEDWPGKNSRVSVVKAMVLSEVRTNNIYKFRSHITENMFRLRYKYEFMSFRELIPVCCEARNRRTIRGANAELLNFQAGQFIQLSMCFRNSTGIPHSWPAVVGHSYKNLAGMRRHLHNATTWRWRGVTRIMCVNNTWKKEVQSSGNWYKWTLSLSWREKAHRTLTYTDDSFSVASARFTSTTAKFYKPQRQGYD